MLFCPSCGVSVTGDKRCCPLCHGKLTGEPSKDVFPANVTPHYSSNFLIKLISTAALSAIAVCLITNYLFPSAVMWSLFAAAGIVCAWITLTVGIKYRSYIIKNITWQLFIVTILAFIWDWFTGKHGWSLDFILPCTCMAAMASMYILSIAMKLSSDQYIVCLALDCIYGFIPLFFILTDRLTYVIPSAVCVIASFISIVALIIFQGRDMKKELQKKFHI